MRGWRIAAVAAFVASVSTTADAQLVRRFIRPELTKEPLKTSSPEDAEYLRTIPLGSQWQGLPTAGSPMCFWRSPMRSRGGYVDGEVDAPMAFYARVAFPRAGMQSQNVTFGNVRDFAGVAYLELKGTLSDKGQLQWEMADVVIPPLTTLAGGPPPFTVARVTLGEKTLRGTTVRPVVPGLPVRVPLSDFGQTLTGLQGGAPLKVWVGRFAPASEAGAPAFTVEGAFPDLAVDAEMIRAKLVLMQRQFHAGTCKGVFPAECYDGACG